MASPRGAVNKEIFHERSVKTVSVYFSGTANSVVGGYTQITLFHEYTDAFELHENTQMDQVPIDRDHFKYAFDGCGVTNGLMGTIFAQGLEEQCRLVSKTVNLFIELGYKIKLNCFGLSRGGMAILILIKQLAHRTKTELEINSLLFDPVPGNLIISGKIDIFGGTLAKQCMDITDSQNLRRVLAIYPYEPLPDLAFHAPIIPSYPTHCEIEEDVTLGCHQGALLFPSNLQTQLSFLRIKAFMEECGTVFYGHITQDHPVSEENCFYEMEEECNRQISSSRVAHCQTAAVILREPAGTYLNYHHLQLKRKYAPDDEEELRFILHITKDNGTTITTQ